VLELTEPEQTYTSNLAGLNAQEAQLTQGIGQAQGQLLQLRLTRQQEIANDMQVAAAAVAQARQALLAAEAVQERRDVTAPEDGVVTNIQLYTPGSSIQAGQTIMELVPRGDRLIIEAHVAPIDIEQVVAGQRANTRLLSYRHRQLPVIPGRVLTVSPDQQVDNVGGAPYYLVRLEMETEQLAHYPRVLMTAGMPTESYIIGQARTVASYIVAPIRDAMYRTMRD
jgi:HlyD family type I secretion membrane fusion protein